MASITLDPRLLAPPETSASAEEFRAYVERLLSWSAFAKEKGSSVSISRDAQERLIEDQALPFAVELKKCLKSKGVLEYDLKTLRDFCEGFFRYEPCFQDLIEVNEILYDNKVFSPSFCHTVLLPHTSMEAEKNLVTLAILDHCGCDISKIGFALQSPIAAQQVSATCQLHAIEHTRTDLGTLGALPAAVCGNVTVCSSLEDFATNCDRGTLFQSADDDQLQLCIKLALYSSRLERGLDPDWTELPDIRMGSDFRMRAQCVGQLKTGLPSNILNTIVDVYEGLNERQTHAIRIGAGGGDPQRKSGAFGAWRQDVASDVHLHYWKGADGLIELSWVGHPHDDFYIPQPNGK
jgi:hypothetical protein